MKNIPNILTVIRLFLIPVFVIVYFSDSLYSSEWALAIFLIAGVTDLLDGAIARKYKLISKVGTVLDPLADKLMLMTALVCLTLSGSMPIWALVIILIKEIGMIIAGVYMYFRKTQTVIPANFIGKSATMMFTLAVVLIIILPNHVVSLSAIVIAIALKFMSLGSYITHYYCHIKPTHTKE